MRLHLVGQILPHLRVYPVLGQEGFEAIGEPPEELLGELLFSARGQGVVVASGDPQVAQEAVEPPLRGLGSRRLYDRGLDHSDGRRGIPTVGAEVEPCVGTYVNIF